LQGSSYVLANETTSTRQLRVLPGPISGRASNHNCSWATHTALGPHTHTSWATHTALSWLEPRTFTITDSWDLV